MVHNSPWLMCRRQLGFSSLAFRVMWVWAKGGREGRGGEAFGLHGGTDQLAVVITTGVHTNLTPHSEEILTVSEELASVSVLSSNLWNQLGIKSNTGHWRSFSLLNYCSHESNLWVFTIFHSYVLHFILYRQPSLWQPATLGSRQCEIPLFSCSPSH